MISVKTSGGDMGGSGSGNHWRSGKRTTSDMLRLDVYYLHKHGMLALGRVSTLNWNRNGERLASIGIWADNGRIILKYRFRPPGGEWEDKEYPAAIGWTACHFGGKRPWFLCPCCGRRVAVLYGGSIYACRHCHNLAYDCQRKAAHRRLLDRALKIRERMGWETDWGAKPKGMHWKTFERLVAEYERFDAASWVATAERFGMGF
jgi:hypothetical protein